MFRKWLETHSAADYDLSAELYPPAGRRDFWDTKYDPYYVTEAEKYLGCEWPMIRATQYMEYSKSGNRRAQENPHFARRTALCALLLGEVAEYKGRFIPDIIDGLFAICEESFWGVSAHIGGMPTEVTACCIDLFVAETGALLAMVCHMLKDELESLCPRIIPRVESEIRRRIFDSYIDRTDSPWMGYGYPVNNWTSWIISNILTVYLLCEKDKAILAKAVDKMLYEINTLYSSIPEDGGCDEGACYWAVSGGCIFEFCDQLYAASGGKIDFFADEKLRRIGRFEYRAYIGSGYFVNFADGTPKVTHSMVGLLYMIGLRLDDPRFASLAKDLKLHDPERENITPAAERDAKIKRRLYEMIYSKDISNAADFEPQETDILDRTQIAFVRGGGWCVAAKGGHNAENHNHNDVGSFAAYYDSAPVLVDPSCGTYTAASGGASRYDIWTNHSGWHNVPEINGIRQKEGREYRANAFRLEGKTVSISFAGAYPEDAEAVSLDRRISADEAGVTLHDSITLSGIGTVTEHFVTPLPVRVCGERVLIGDGFTLECDTPAEIITDSVSFDGDERLTLYWKVDAMNRIGFTFASGNAANVNFALRRIKE